MKECPVCKTVYTDDSLKFCLADGAGLTSVSKPEETMRMSFGNEPSRVNVQADSVPTVFAPANAPNRTARKGISPLIIAAIGAFFLLFMVGIAGIGAYFLLKANDNQNSSVVTTSPTPTFSPTSSAENDATAELKEKLANLEQQVREQNDQPNTAPTEVFPIAPQAGTNARVNSPRDGFLALRSRPDSETGDRITKIPHGATVNITDCLDYSYIGKTRGRWCRANYDGFDGWVFDGYLIY